VADIESLRIDLQQPFHPENKVGLRCLNDQMKMIAHQAVGMHLPNVDKNLIRSSSSLKMVSRCDNSNWCSGKTGNNSRDIASSRL